MGQTFTLTIEIDGKGQAAIKALKDVGAASEDAGAKTSILRGAYEKLGHIATNMLAQIPQLAGEIVNLGIQSQAVTQRFTAFAGSTEQADEYLQAFQRATDGTVAKMDAMAGASKMLQMGLVSDSDEMEVMAAVATKLGDQTMGAGQRIADFSALLANQSIPRLDNFGISSGKVRARIEELQKATKDMSREEAFKIAVLEEGRKSLEILGDTSQNTATKVGILKSAVQDAKVGVGELAVETLDASGDVTVLAAHIREIPEAMRMWQKAYAIQDLFYQSLMGNAEASRQLNREWGNTVRWAGEVVDRIEGVTRETNKYTAAMEAERWNQMLGIKATEDAVGATEELTEAEQRAIEAKQEAARKERELAEAGAAKWRIKEIKQEQVARENRARVIKYETEVMEEQARIATNIKAATLDMAMSWTKYFDDVDEQAADFAAQREEIEAAHQEKLAEIAVKGQAVAIRIDEGAEQEKLAKLQDNLKYALLEQADYTDKTKEVTQLRKADQIAALQEEIAAQEGMLDAYYGGRLIKAGQNTTAMIAEEEKRHQESLRMLDEEMAKQQQMQDQAMGQLMLQTFDRWSTEKGIATDKALEMRTAIAEEYGLISGAEAAMVQTSVAAWEEWASDTSKNANETIDKIGQEIDIVRLLGDEIEGLPSEKIIKIAVDYKTNRSRLETDIGGILDAGTPGGGSIGVTPTGNAGIENYQGGTMGAPGGWSFIHANELAWTPPGTRIYPASQSKQMIYNSQDTYNITDNAALRWMEEQQRRDKRAAYGSL